MSLTPRELEVLRLLCRGGSQKDVMRELGIAQSTAKTHTKRIYRKLQVRGNCALLGIRAVERELLKSGPPAEVPSAHRTGQVRGHPRPHYNRDRLQLIGGEISIEAGFVVASIKI